MALSLFFQLNLTTVLCLRSACLQFIKCWMDFVKLNRDKTELNNFGPFFANQLGPLSSNVCYCVTNCATLVLFSIPHCRLISRCGEK